MECFDLFVLLYFSDVLIRLLHNLQCIFLIAGAIPLGGLIDYGVGTLTLLTLDFIILHNNLL